MKLYYIYGTMNSAKSLNLLAKAHQFEETGSKVLLLKPSFDTRTKNTIKTRVGLEKPCIVIGENQNIAECISGHLDCDTIFVDECQFLSVEQIEQLWILSRSLNKRIFCYGLKTDFNNNLFDASARLLVLADKVEELISKCQFCGSKATTHKKVGGDMTKNEVGDINSDSSVRYESVCQTCYRL